MVQQARSRNIFLIYGEMRSGESQERGRGLRVDQGIDEYPGVLRCVSVEGKNCEMNFFGNSQARSDLGNGGKFLTRLALAAWRRNRNRIGRHYLSLLLRQGLRVGLHHRKRCRRRNPENDERHASKSLALSHLDDDAIPFFHLRCQTYLLFFRNAMKNLIPGIHCTSPLFFLL